MRIVLSLASLVLVACVSGKAEVTVRNSSSSKISNVEVSTNKEVYSFSAIMPGSVKTRSLFFRGDGDYSVIVKFSDGRELKNDVGYYSGVGTYRAQIEITDEQINFDHVSHHFIYE